MRRSLWLVMGWVVVLAAVRPLQADVTFRYQFEPGTIWLYNMTVEGDGDMEITNPQAPDGAMVMPLNMQMDMDMEQQVVSMDDATSQARIAVRMPTMNMVTQVMGMGIEMTLSGDGMKVFVNGQEQPVGEETPNLAEMPLFGKPLHIEVTPVGKVVKMDKFDPAALGGMMGNQMPMLQNLQQFQQPQNWFVLFPEEAIPVGHTWKQEQEMPVMQGMAPLKLTTDYRFEGWENVGDIQCAKIATKMTFEIKDANLQPQPAPAAEPKAEAIAYQPEAAQPPAAEQPPTLMLTIQFIKMEMEGPLYFNVDAGRIERQLSELHMEMQMGFGTPEGQMGFSMLMTMKTEMDLKEVKKAEI